MTTFPSPQAPAPGAIVVGVGLEGSDAAITFAAAEACRTGRPLHLVHLLRIPAADAFVGVYTNALTAAEERLERALTLARRLVAGRVAVTGERIDNDWLVKGLTTHVADASMIVLQHRGMNPVQRFVAGSTVAGVAARSPVPVVSVPEMWKPETTSEPVVTVGVQDAVEAEPLITRALQTASDRHARVAVVHAWWLYGGYDSVVDDEQFRAALEREAIEQITPGLERARRAFPDVPVTIDIQHATPVTALRDATADSVLVIIGRRHHRLPIGSHLGPVARAVLRDATGPVLVHPEFPAVPDASHEQLEQTGRHESELDSSVAAPSR